MNTARPSRKLVAGGVSGLTVGTALTTILLYLIEAAMHQPLPLAVQAAVSTLVTTAAVVIVGYLTAPGADEAILPG
ncbi:MAG: hypothetical protein KGL54_13445 [Sphingomonadales bacterium]|nr:hypothetical protein [Sphingomonadales bacterium]